MEQELYKRSKRQEARKDIISCLLPLALASCLLFLIADTVNAKECSLMGPEVLKKYIRNGTINNMNMLMFDIRPRSRQGNPDWKYIARTIPAPLSIIKRELVGKVKELIGKDVILVGENTKSAESVCGYMIKKDYGIRNIYVLKGGVEKWNGPVMDYESASKVECKSITPWRLMDMMKSNRKVKVEIIDKRPSEKYYEGHIPGARLEKTGREQEKIIQDSIKRSLQELEMSIKWEQENVTVVYVYDDEWRGRWDCRYRKYWAWWGYENIYMLRGGMKDWEGEVEKDSH